MTDDELERLLGDAFHAQARSSVGDSATPPPPRFAHADDPLRRGHASRRPATRRRFLAPLAAAAAVVAIAGGALAVTHAVSDDHPRSPAAASAPAGRATTSVSTSSAAKAGPPVAVKPAANAVRVKLLNSDGASYGVGMPVIAYFSRQFTDGRALQQATTVSVNGRSQQAAWYVERSSYLKGYPLEAHLRLENYWPAHATVRVTMPIKGRSAGGGLVFGNDLTLDFHTGAAMVAVVDDQTHRMTVTRDGKPDGRYPVSLGSTSTPTSRGTKVIMEKGASICMTGPGYRECGVKYTQRLTYGGEYLHAAPWNVKNIEAGIDSSNGCTNLTTGDARTLYSAFQVGDIVRYPNSDGRPMTLGAGYGDWNIDWSTWQVGGLVRTH